MPNVVSVITVPPSAPPTSSPAMVTTGVIAARSACRPYTLGLARPLARAVRTKSSDSVSSICARDSRA